VAVAVVEAVRMAGAVAVAEAGAGAARCGRCGGSWRR